jgi:PAS domain S-box-containing protein
MNINKELDLYQFEQLNQTLFNNHPDAIYILDLEGRFTMVNEEVCRITGLERELLIGSSFEPLIFPAYHAVTLEMFLLAKQDCSQRGETAIVTKEGIKYLDVTNFPLKVNDKIVATFGIAKDITEKQQKERELKEYAALLKAQNGELEIFRKVIAHDLRKPVANAIGLAKLLAESRLPLEKEKEVKSLLVKTVVSVDTMVRDLYDVISQKHLGREVKERIALQAFVDNIMQSFACDIERINASVTLRLEPGLFVFTVEAYFKSILQNIISNALKYHSRINIPTIEIKAEAVEAGVEIRIADNGVGMDLAIVSEELFQMHKRFAPSLAEGKGLGLYIVKEQIKLLGGTISVSSKPNIGTDFKIFLPTT